MSPKSARKRGKSAAQQRLAARGLSPEERELLRRKKAYYSGFRLDDFRRRREEFRALDLGDPKFDVVAAARVVTQSPSTTDHLLPFSWESYYPGDAVLWRARAITREQGIAGFFEEDLWDPPRSLSGTGRMNKAGERLLYASLDTPGIALRESRIAGVGQRFAMAKFGLSRRMTLMRIGPPNHDPSLTFRERLLEAEIGAMLEDAIRSPTADRGPDTYRFTRELLHHYYPLPDEHHGWLYRSARDIREWNVALPSSRARSVLEFRGVVIGYVASDRGPRDLDVSYADWATHEDVLPNGRIGFPNRNVAPAENPVDLLP